MTENNKIKIGDVVILKSGGPSMTVYDLSNGRALVVWFNPVNFSEVYHDEFPLKALSKQP